MQPPSARIVRVWRGWTTRDNAARYQSVVYSEVLPAIFARGVPGLLAAHLMRAPRPDADEVEFSTILWFDSPQALASFAGDAVREAHVPAIARAVLKRFDQHASHYELIDYFEA